MKCNGGCDKEAIFGNWCCERYYNCPGYRKRLSDKAKLRGNNGVRGKLSKKYFIDDPLKQELFTFICSKCGKEYTKKLTRFTALSNLHSHMCSSCYNKKSLCEYGCRRKALYKLKNGKLCCEKNYNSCPSIRKKNGIGAKQSFKNGRITSTSYTPESRHKMGGRNRGSISHISKIIPSVMLLVRLGLKKYQCEMCGVSTWNNSILALELDHIDGNHKNNDIENLRIVCLNCHSQTETFRNKKRNSLNIITDDDVVAGRVWSGF